MKIVSTAQMRSLERTAIAAGTTEPALMQEAGLGIASILMREFPDADDFVFFCGKGHNGGDGIVAARSIEQHGRKATCFSPYALNEPDVWPFDRYWRPSARAVLVDALLGMGARTTLSPELRVVTEGFLQAWYNPVVALDIPSGVDADTGDVSEGAVFASMTICCGFPKQGLFSEGAIPHVGRIAVAALSLPSDAVQSVDNGMEFLLPAEARSLLRPRLWNAHKGMCGHLHIVAGSIGKVGAAILCARSALSVGAGLVTLYVPETIYPAVAAAQPEVMVIPVSAPEEALRTIPPHTVCVVGPGMGTHEEAGHALEEFLADTTRVVVLDADAITLLAQNRNFGHLLNENILLTPHPGEMRRLYQGRDIPRLDAVHDFVGRYPSALVLKGAYTLVAQQGLPVSINSTGNPGMAVGGMGDALAGMCGAHCAQGYSVYDSARLSVYLHGLAADIAVRQACSIETLLPSDMLHHMAAAFQELRTAWY